MNQKKLADIVSQLRRETHFPTTNDSDFFDRIFGDGNLSKYETRLDAIGFTGRERILDAGCGFAQWCFSMSPHNEAVVGLDTDPFRLEIAKKIKDALNLSNLDLVRGSIESLPLDLGQFDAIFSYNSITLSPYRQTLQTFVNILKLGGLLYFNAADLGWFIYNILDQHNPSADFSPRQWGIDTIRNSIQYYATGKFSQQSPRDSILIPLEIVKEDLASLGFEIIAIGGDGEIDVTGQARTNPFFPKEKYGMNAVYEVLCRKVCV